MIASTSNSTSHCGSTECMSVHAVAGLIKFFSPVSRAGLSTCPGRDLPGQLDGLLRTSLPGKTVTGQDPASLDRLDLFQRGQGPVVILVQEPGEQLRPGLAGDKAERRQRVARDQDFTVGQAQGRVSGGVAGRVGDTGPAWYGRNCLCGETPHLG